MLLLNHCAVSENHVWNSEGVSSGRQPEMRLIIYLSGEALLQLLVLREDEDRGQVLTETYQAMDVVLDAFSLYNYMVWYIVGTNACGSDRLFSTHRGRLVVSHNEVEMTASKRVGYPHR